jgi:DNA-binding response OmpR family regulator
MTVTALARVLLIEDDPSIRHFVDLALEDEPIELHQAATVGEAMDHLRTNGPFRLVMTDLMLPDGNGQQVLQTLATEPSLRGGARIAVFSAGVSAQTRASLAALGVDEILTKPAPLGQVLDCVRRALQAASPAGLAEPLAAEDDAPAAPSDAVAAAVDAAVDAAVVTYFSGDRALYDLYRDSCRRQFPLDRVAGDAALDLADLPALRRLAHSLKTVLKTLGHDLESLMAGQLERAATDGRTDEVHADWARLGPALDRLSRG